MRKAIAFLSSLLVIFLTIFTVISVDSTVSARNYPQDNESIARGAQLYDDWSKILPNVVVPSGNHLLWSRQTNNTRTGEDTWKCVTCHGWDYQGKDGALKSGANATGFPGILGKSNSSESEIVAILKGGNDPQHNFNSLLTEKDLSDIAEFIKYGLIDDNEFIDLVTRKVISGDLVNGKSKYENECATCHGSNGTNLIFRYEGSEISLGTLAIQDPWRFLHRTRFGTARAPEMPLGVNIGWTPQDGRDVLYYVQTNLPTGLETTESMPIEITPVVNEGGPARSLWTGILTAFGAMGISLGFAILLGAVFIGIILLIVWLIRSRQS